MPYITHYGTPEQIEKFIPDMTAGRKIGAIAMTEPDAGRWVSTGGETKTLLINTVLTSMMGTW